MCEMVPDYRDGRRLENKEQVKFMNWLESMKTDSDTDIKEQELDGTAISALIVDEPMLNEKTEDKTSDKAVLDEVLKENFAFRIKLDQVSAICGRWFANLSPADKIEIMARYYQLRLNCYENNKKESK